MNAAEKLDAALKNAGEAYARLVYLVGAVRANKLWHEVGKRKRGRPSGASRYTEADQHLLCELYTQNPRAVEAFLIQGENSEFDDALRLGARKTLSERMVKASTLESEVSRLRKKARDVLLPVFIAKRFDALDTLDDQQRQLSAEAFRRNLPE